MTESTRGRKIKVDYLARVEGEGALYVKIDRDQVEEVRFQIFEPPRFFEAFLRGRRFDEVPDITARICGICPIAYMMGSSQAMEMACGVDVPADGALSDLRRLIYCGEWIESHVLHIFMLHAPDFLGYPDAMAMARDHRQLVENALRLKKIGNRLMTVIGGREVHPVNLRVGGFYRSPDKAALQQLVPELEWALGFAGEAVGMLAGLPYPDFNCDYEFMALQHESEYAITHGRLVSSRGVDLDIRDYDDWLKETHVPHSTALQSRTREGGTVFTGPLARVNLNQQQLTPQARLAANRAGFDSIVTNPFKSILARAVEVIFALEESLRLIRRYEPPTASFIPVEPRAGRGYGATEAPRGICYHRYDIDGQGLVTDAKIVAPTSVNQARIEQDLREYIPARIDLDDDSLRHQCEQAVRNYDPCISCSAHFLKLTVERHS